MSERPRPPSIFTPGVMERFAALARARMIPTSPLDETTVALECALTADDDARTAQLSNWAGQLITSQANAAPCSAFLRGIDLLAAAVEEVSPTIAPSRDVWSQARGAAADAACRRRDETDVHRQQFVALLEQINEFACLASLQGRPLFINQAGRRLLGLGPSEDLTERTLREFIAEDTWKLLGETAIPTVQRLGTWTGAGQLKRAAGGEPLTAAFTLSLVREAASRRPLCVAMVLRDAAARIRPPYLPRDGETLYTSLVEALPLSVFRKDLQGRRTFGNRRYCELMGRSLEQLLGKTDFDLFPKELAEKYQRDDRTVIETGQPLDIIDERETPEGEKHFVQVWKIPVYDQAGQVTGTQGVFWDVTRQRQAEEALQESEARKSMILESALDAIVTIDHTGRICEFNRAAERTFERPRAQVLGKDPSEILFPSENRQGHRDRLDRYMTTGQGSLVGRRTEVQAVRASGEAFTAEMAMTMSRMQGVPVCTFFLRDISDRLLAEEARNRHAAELARSNAELQQFAYAASHDLQEPLRKIQAFGDRLKTKFAAALGDDGRDYLERMQSAASRMQELIRGLLELSRVTTKGQQFVDVDLAETAKQVLSDLEVRIEQMGAKVEVGGLPIVRGDPLQMRQLFQNLLGNALKFHPPGEPPRVELHADLLTDGGNDSVLEGPGGGASCWRISIRDHGIGFDEKHLERIFGVFQRLHSREEYEGAGLGLAICRKIVERHGGSITARSEPGGGACFLVTLPAEMAEAVGESVA